MKRIVEITLFFVEVRDPQGSHVGDEWARIIGRGLGVYRHGTHFKSHALRLKNEMQSLAMKVLVD